ncbi:hypothetical protein M432DRAFT_657804 [Thermoascus aurantiacus ATCC 26904]
MAELTISNKIEAVEVVTVGLSAFLTGYYLVTSTVFIPAVLRAPAAAPIMVRQWKRPWDVGRIVGKLFVVTTAAGFAYLAYTEPTGPAGMRCKLFTAAAALVGAVAPCTAIVGYPVNEALVPEVERLQGEGEGGKKGEGKREGLGEKGQGGCGRVGEVGF